MYQKAKFYKLFPIKDSSLESSNNQFSGKITPIYDNYEVVRRKPSSNPYYTGVHPKNAAYTPEKNYFESSGVSSHHRKPNIERTPAPVLAVCVKANGPIHKPLFHNCGLRPQRHELHIAFCVIQWIAISFGMDLHTCDCDMARCRGTVGRSEIMGSPGLEPLSHTEACPRSGPPCPISKSFEAPCQQPAPYLAGRQQVRPESSADNTRHNIFPPRTQLHLVVLTPPCVRLHQKMRKPWCPVWFWPCSWACEVHPKTGLQHRCSRTL